MSSSLLEKGDKKRKVEEVDNYASEAYWDSRYEQNVEHEWYFSYEDLHPLFAKKYAPDSFEGSVLEIGCGDRPMIPGFVAAYPTCTLACGMDYSQNAVDMAGKVPIISDNKDVVSYARMDARKMTYSTDSFDIVIDKGTIDAMMSDADSKAAAKNVKQIIKETLRVMKPAATFVLISHVEVECEEFEELFGGLIVPQLEALNHLNWTIEAHTGCRNNGFAEEEQVFCGVCVDPNATDAANNEEEEEDKGESGGSGATVYFITSNSRPFTRTSAKSKNSILVKLIEYVGEGGGEEEESDDDDDDK